MDENAAIWQALLATYKVMRELQDWIESLPVSAEAFDTTLLIENKIKLQNLLMAHGDALKMDIGQKS